MVNHHQGCQGKLQRILLFKYIQKMNFIYEIITTWKLKLDDELIHSGIERKQKVANFISL